MMKHKFAKDLLDQMKADREKAVRTVEGCFLLLKIGFMLGEISK